MAESKGNNRIIQIFNRLNTNEEKLQYYINQNAYIKKVIKNHLVSNSQHNLLGKIPENVTRNSLSENVTKTNSLFDELMRLISQNKVNKTNKESSELLISWIHEHIPEIRYLLEPFDEFGKTGEISATTFNDFYKWSMLPVIRHVETCGEYEDKSIHVTFSVNIRTPEERKSLVSHTEDGARLRHNILEALNKLKDRKFDRNLFKDVIELKKINIDDETVDLICGSEYEESRSLIDHVTDKKYEPREWDTNDVVVSFFEASDTKLVGEFRMYIEASGPWHRVTWLETTLMQCVYEVILRDKLEKDKKTYAEWLLEALGRCSRSVCAVKKLETDHPENILKGALFTGRRTGGLPFLLLQNLFLADNYPNCIGTSSVDAWYTIKTMVDNLSKNKGDESGEENPSRRILIPVGTHAHELSMVFSSLFSIADESLRYPLSQIMSHYLYYLTSSTVVDAITGLPLCVPMLPDTLGTKAFMITASMIRLPNGIPFMEIINNARQDSGELEDFSRTMDDFGFDGAIMASEIEKISDLEKAGSILRKLKNNEMPMRKNGNLFAYSTFGAGGFFGDSVKAWNSKKSNISMAVKAVRVFVDGEETEFKPTKIGDSANAAKFEINGLLAGSNYNKARNRAFSIKSRGNNKSNYENNRIRLQQFFDEMLKDGLGIEFYNNSNNGSISAPIYPFNNSNNNNNNGYNNPELNEKMHGNYLPKPRNI